VLTGREAEDHVARALHDAGWTECARNWRGGGGEIDLVVARGGAVRFVEVKLREATDPLGDDAVTLAKQRLLRQAARAWLAVHGEPRRECAFLVAMVDHDGEIRLIDDAFDG